jgi:hypothetical protein
LVELCQIVLSTCADDLQRFFWQYSMIFCHVWAQKISDPTETALCGVIENKSKLSPDKAGAWGELGNIKEISLSGIEWITVQSDVI